MQRDYFTSIEVYQLGEVVGVPVSRSALHWFRKEGVFKPVAKVYNFFVYTRSDIIDIVGRLSKRKNASISNETINNELDIIADRNPIITSLIIEAVKK